MSKKVWLLGADSFTGGYLIPELESQGYSVNSTEIDITNSIEVNDAMQSIKPDYIINLAAISFVPDGISETIYAVNTLGPQNLLDAALKLEQPPQHIILASSANVYGEQQQEKITENCIPNPVNHYGCSKWSMEQIARTYSDRLAITITRPFNYTGIGQDEKFLVPKIVSHFKSKENKIKLGNIDVWRDFSDVRWIAKAYSQLLLSTPQSVNVVNLCSGKLVSVREIINTLQSLTAHQIEIEIDPKFVRASEIQKQCGDNRYLYQLVPKLASPIDIDETLESMLRA